MNRPRIVAIASVVLVGTVIAENRRIARQERAKRAAIHSNMEKDLAAIELAKHSMLHKISTGHYAGVFDVNRVMRDFDHELDVARKL